MISMAKLNFYPNHLAWISFSIMRLMCLTVWIRSRFALDTFFVSSSFMPPQSLCETRMLESLRLLYFYIILAFSSSGQVHSHVYIGSKSFYMGYVMGSDFSVFTPLQNLTRARPKRGEVWLVNGSSRKASVCANSRNLAG